MKENLTNDIKIKNDTIVKKYNLFPLTSFLQFLTYLVCFKLYYPSREKRIKNDIEFKNKLEKHNFKIPKVKERDNNKVIFEYIDGIQGYEYVNNKKTDSKEFGENLGILMKRLHSETQLCLKDARLSNFIVKNSDIYLIDHEYSLECSNNILKKIDLISLIASSRQSTEYNSFVKGFEKEYPVSKSVKMIAFLSALTSCIIHRKISCIKNLN